MINANPSCLIRRATPDDAAALAELANFAGEGMPLYLWERMAEEGETGWQIGCCRVLREEGDFSYRNAMVTEIEGKVAACLIGYLIPHEPEDIDTDTMPAMFVPLQELENFAAGCWYSDILATYPRHRGKGLGTELLERAEEKALKMGCKELAIIVSDANTGARRLYERCGYTARAAREMVKEGWKNPGRNWVLLTK